MLGKFGEVVIAGAIMALLGCTKQSGQDAEAENTAAIVIDDWMENEDSVRYEESEVSVTLSVENRHYGEEAEIFAEVAIDGNDSRVEYVELFVDGDSAGQENQPPFLFDAGPLPQGEYRLIALAKMKDKSSATSDPISVSISPER